MKKTFCDRCGVECNGQSVQRFTIFDVNRAIDVCENCYSEFFRWLNSEKDKPTPLGVHYSGEIISLDKDDSDGVDEFIKDVKNDSDGLDDIHKGCDGCMYHHLGWHQEPCQKCIRKRYIFREKIEVGDSDNYINKEETDENCLCGGCDNCYYIDKKYFDYPCRECTRCNVNNGYVKADHFVKGDEKQ